MIRYYLSPIREERAGDVVLARNGKPVTRQDGTTVVRTTNEDVAAALDPVVRGGPHRPGDRVRVYDPPVDTTTGRHLSGWALVQVDTPDHARYRADPMLLPLLDLDPDSPVDALSLVDREALRVRVESAGLTLPALSGRYTMEQVASLLRAQVSAKVTRA